MSSEVNRARWKRLAVNWAFWTAFGTYETIQAHTQSALWGRSTSWAESARSEFLYAYAWAILTPAVLIIVQRFRLPSRKWPQIVAIHTACAILSAAIVKILWDLAFQPPRSFFINGITWTSIAASVASAIDVGFLLYWVIGLSAWGYDHYRNLEKERLAAAELQRQFALAQAEALRMQLHPHFLFNSLHTITGLVHEDPDLAERMIARLSEFLRHSLEAANAPMVSLDDELRFLRMYLEIEKIRFEERLTVQYDITPDAKDAAVPNLILQPLVENSIRHAIAHRISGGRIDISAHVHGGELMLTVEDNGADAKSPQAGNGVGLGNTRTRLATLYGDRQTVTMLRNEAGGMRTVLTLPFQPVAKMETTACES